MFINLENHLIKGEWRTVRIEHQHLPNLPGKATVEIGKVDEHNNWNGSGRFFLTELRGNGWREDVNQVKSALKVAV